VTTEHITHYKRTHVTTEHTDVTTEHITHYKRTHVTTEHITREHT
jgi:hypothetical protein